MQPAAQFCLAPGIIPESQASKTYTFNTPGTYNYEAMGDIGVIMKGTITVKNIQSPVTTSAAAAWWCNRHSRGIDGSNTSIDKYMQDVKNAGLTVDSTHNFNDLRGGQKWNRRCADTISMGLRR